MRHFLRFIGGVARRAANFLKRQIIKFVEEIGFPNIVCVALVDPSYWVGAQLGSAIYIVCVSANRRVVGKGT